MKLHIGPVDVRFFQGQGDDHHWTHLELALITNRNGGKARRESALRAGFKSEHLTDTIGRNNPADRFVCPNGSVVFGKIVQTPTGVYAISAEEVFSRGLFEEACRNGLIAAENATSSVPVSPEPEPQPTPVA